MMNNAYLAICYICNEYCKYCPCGKRESQNNIITSFEILKTKIDQMKKEGIVHITISGGEPTLHPDFIEVVKYICSLGMNVTILSNGENFDNDFIFKNIEQEWDLKKIRIITTIHSQYALEHEKANRKVGSFKRSIQGLKRIEKLGIKIIIKHCITRDNYEDLADFYWFVDNNFGEETDIQLCSIDYVGIPKDQLKKEMLSFIELKPYLEAIFDCHISSKNNRKLYCINIPLCSCDPYYWKYLPIRKRKMYDSYSDPVNNSVIDVEDNVSIDEKYCKECCVKAICNGTYKTAFSNFGSEMIKPYKGVN